MKKLLLGLGAATAVLAPIATVVACGDSDGADNSKTIKIPTADIAKGNLVASAIKSGATLEGGINVHAISDDEVVYTFKITETNGDKHSIIVTDGKPRKISIDGNVTAGKEDGANERYTWHDSRNG